MSHYQDALKYAKDVASGAIPAGSYVVKACKRHLSDIEKADSAGFKYYFDESEANRVCSFIELLPHTKGRWAAKAEKIALQPWQKFIFCVLFGWLKKSNGKRRFRACYLEIPRKNGKSIIAAGVGLYMMLMDGEFGAEVYSGATTEKQAWEVFKPAKLMLERTEELREALGAEVCAKALIRPGDGSKFEPVIGDPGDGSSPSCAIVDEFHEHDTPRLYDTMETGMGAREQPLMFVITTAGYNLAGPCFEKHTELKQVLDEITENDELFGVIYGIDVGDDWADPKVLRKANPNFGVSVDGEFLESQQRQAMTNPVHQNKFKTKHLNVWCSVLNGWMNMAQWHASADLMLDIDELAGSDCWFALDLASKSDLCALQMLFRRESHGQFHYYLFGRYWLPEAAIDEPGKNHASYLKWVNKGLLCRTDGATVDFDLIKEEVIALAKKYNPAELVYDPFNATQTAAALMGEGIDVVEFTQNPGNFAVPMDELQTAVKDGRFHHDGNELTTWCFSNVCAKPAKKGLVAPVKQKGQEHQKIDGAVSAIMAMSRAAIGGRAESIDDFLNNPIHS
jgi:phage terminase large subunit-like protein